MSPRLLLLPLLFCSAVANLWSSARCQCSNEWQPHPSGPPAVAIGLNGAVHSMVQLPNGDVVVGGNFSTANGVPVSRIARWNGREWRPLGSGMDTLLTTTVHALAVLPNGDLVAGGSFTMAGGVTAFRVARWNGVSWSPLGGGCSGTVRALAVLPDGSLVAGGDFTSAGGSTVNRIARWDGAAWTGLGSGMATGTNVRCLLVRSNGDLIAGGAFATAGGNPASNIARWDGSAWSPLGTGCNNSVNALIRLANGDVVAGGSFNTAGGGSAPFAARWNGSSWSAMGALTSTVTTLSTLGDEVVAAGAFAGLLRRWDGTAWVAIGTPPSSFVNSLLELPGDHLLVGGGFSTIGGITAPCLAHWDRTTWSPVGSTQGYGFDDTVHCLAECADGALVAGGVFLTVAGRPCSRIALWDGVLWSPLGSGCDAMVRSLAVMPDGRVIAGGDFLQAGGVAVQRIAAWNGTTWSPLGSGSLSSVHVLAVTPNGTLHAGGKFPWGPLPGWERAFAQWTGSTWAAWGALASSYVASALVPLADGALLYGVTVTNVLAPVVAPGIYGTTSFDTGWSWFRALDLEPLPGGKVMAVASDFFGASKGITIWDGATWSPLAAANVDALETLPGGDVVAGGTFSTIGGVAANRLARWNQTAWSAIDTGTDAAVEALAFTSRRGLAIGGAFTQANGLDAQRFATLQTTCPARALPRGLGCTGSGGLNLLAATSLPWVGTTCRTQATGMPQFAFILAITGFSPQSLPLGLALPQAFSGCSLYTSPDFVEVMLPSNGTAATQLQVPNNLALAGQQVHQQMVPLEVDLSLTITGVTSTNAVTLTIGTF